jgi:hypothetical protein
VAGVLLYPFTGRIPVVDVVAEVLHAAAPKVWSFLGEALIVPILLEAHDLRDAHRVDEVACFAVRSGAGADYPVVDLGDLADVLLAGG